MVGKSATGMQNVVADEAHAWHQASVQHVLGIVQNFGERFNGRLREGILLVREPAEGERGGLERLAVVECGR